MTNGTIIICFRSKEQLNIQWTGYGKKTAVITFNPEVVLNKKTTHRTVGGKVLCIYHWNSLYWHNFIQSWICFICNVAEWISCEAFTDSYWEIL